METKSGKFSSRLIELEYKGGGDGYLVPLEEESEEVPFPIKRVYYIYNVGFGLRRGYHAHRELKQLVICVSGSCKIDLDNSNSRVSFILNRPNTGLLIDEVVWREMYDFSEDCVLLVLASDHYNPADYISNFREFKEFLRGISDDNTIDKQELGKSV